MPLTKSQYIVSEDEDLVMWEREVRKFLSRLSVQYEHRVTASMIYEWATGIPAAQAKGAGTVDFRKINKILQEYFGKSYSTWICGRKVKSAYKVPGGWYVKRHAPKTLTLWAEWQEGTLNP